MDYYPPILDCRMVLIQPLFLSESHTSRILSAKFAFLPESHQFCRPQKHIREKQGRLLAGAAEHEAYANPARHDERHATIR